MRKPERLSVSDIKGAWAILPTPSKPNASDWRARDTVDLDEAARVVEGLIDAGINGILSMGTLGEAATLTYDEKIAYMQVLVESARGRVPVFVGTTTLNTRDTIDLTLRAQDIGADGTMLGIPMWCAPSLDIAVQFYKDVTAGAPDMNYAIYANPESFKFDFPRAFWVQVAQLPQVVTAKYIGIGPLMRDMAAVRGNIKMLPLDFDYYAAARMDDFNDAFWTSGAVCGPSVAIYLRDVVDEARKTGNWAKARAFQAKFASSAATLFPGGSFQTFSMYNVALEKARMDAGGWMKAGPVRPPYHICPEEYLAGARNSGEMWAALHQELTSGKIPSWEAEL